MSTSRQSRSPTPSGRQVGISSGPYSCVTVEVGGGLRVLRHETRDLIEPYAADAIASAAHGQALLPWPNRIMSGRYTFAGEHQQLALTQPGEGNAIHGLTRWANWLLVDQQASSVRWEYRLHPQPGYPHTLDLMLGYLLDAQSGLTVTVAAHNVGATAAPFGVGFHPYLSLDGGDVDDARLQVPAQTSQPDAGISLMEGAALRGVILDHGFGSLISDGGRWRARLSIGDIATEVWADDAFRWAQVFTADPFGRKAVAIEPMTCPADAFNSGTDLLVLEPDATWSASWGIDSHLGH